MTRVDIEGETHFFLTPDFETDNSIMVAETQRKANKNESFVFTLVLKVNFIHIF